jgi:NAD(P)-dependent dehydrogenase (short-subunit alcohol dehydrogenase family)
MLMASQADLSLDAGALCVYPELVGRRVLITGITSVQGCDMVRAFAEHRTRLYLQLDEETPETQAMLEMAAPLAAELAVSNNVAQDADAQMHFARGAFAAFGGFDAVVNLVSLAPQADMPASQAAIERRIGDLMAGPCLISRVAANRMRLTRTEGLILNVACLTRAADPRLGTFAALAKATLAAMTRREAEDWTGEGIRINAIAPSVALGALPRLSGEADAAALAVYLASGRGTALAGQVFEAEPAWAA